VAINGNNLEPEFDALLKAHVQRRADRTVCHQFNPDDATAYLERAMSKAVLMQFEEHLASCSVCRRHLIELSRLMPTPTIFAEAMPAPFSFKDRLSEWFSGWRLGLMAGMGAVAATVLLVAVVMNRSASNETALQVAVRQDGAQTAPLPEAALQSAPATKPQPSASPEPDKKLSDEIGSVKGIGERSVSPVILAPAVGEPGATAMAPPPPPVPPPATSNAEAERKEVTASQAPAAGGISQNQTQTLRGQAPGGPEANQFQAERALETRKREAQAAQSADSGAPVPAKPAAKAVEPPAERSVEKSKKDIAQDVDKKQMSAKTDSRPSPSTAIGRVAPAARTVAGKTFRQENGIWVDTSYQPGNNLPVVRLTRDSREFQQTLKNLPGLKPYFDLKPVIVVWQGKVYRVENK